MCAVWKCVCSCVGMFVCEQVCVCRCVPAMCVDVRQLWVLGLWSESLLLGFCAKSRLANQVVAGSRIVSISPHPKLQLPTTMSRFFHIGAGLMSGLSTYEKNISNQAVSQSRRSSLQLCGLRWVWLSSLAWSTFWSATCLGLPNMGIVVLNSHTWLFTSKLGKDISGLEGAVRLFLQRTQIPFSATAWQL